MAVAGAMTFDYGESNFYQVRTKNQYFADTTQVIRKLENRNSSHKLLCRPPGFGKSLLLSTMKWYYDELTTVEQFQSLFSELDIGKNQTPRARSYKVLQMSLTPKTGSIESDQTIRLAVDNCINAALLDFKDHYDLSFHVKEDAYSSLHRMCNELSGLERRGKPQRLLILIDEYDGIANKLLENDCHDDAMRLKLQPIQNKFVCLKDLAGTAHISEFETLTVGIMPLCMAQMSGWNMVDDLSFDSAFSCALGLNEQQVASALEHLDLKPDSPEHQSILELLRHHCNGYCFAESYSTLFNPQLILRFCQLYQENTAFKHLVLDQNWAKWDDAKQFRDFMNSSDANVLPSEGLYPILKQLPACSTSLLLALASERSLTRSISVEISAIRRGLLPSTMSSNRVQVLWFMFFHGLVTCSPIPLVYSSEQDASEDTGSGTSKSSRTLKGFLPIASSYKLRVPNRLVRQGYLAELTRRLSDEDDYLTRLLNCPNATNLHELLRHVVFEQQSEKSDELLSLQAELEAALRCMCSTSKSLVGNCPQVHASYKMHDANGEELECDLLVVWGTIVMHIESKRVRHGDIDFGDIVFGCWVWTSISERVNERTNLMTDAQLRQLAIKRKSQHEEAGSVEELHIRAMEQLRVRLPLLRNEWPGHHVHQFAVVQVASRFLVEELITNP